VPSLGGAFQRHFKVDDFVPAGAYLSLCFIACVGLIRIHTVERKLLITVETFALHNTTVA
jgi:hypothetical protein